MKYHRFLLLALGSLLAVSFAQANDRVIVVKNGSQGGHGSYYVAQAPAPAPTHSAPAPVLSAPVYVQSAPYGHSAPCCAPVCEPCCPVPEKYCVPEHGIKKTTKYKYDCKCVDFCLPKCNHSGLLGKFKLFGHGCNSCEPVACAPCADCEKPRTRKVLIKKPYVVEECEVTCKVVDPCACPTDAKAAPAVIVKPAAPVEIAPLPKEKK